MRKSAQNSILIADTCEIKLRTDSLVFIMHSAVD